MWKGIRSQWRGIIKQHHCCKHDWPHKNHVDENISAVVMIGTIERIIIFKVQERHGFFCAKTEDVYDQICVARVCEGYL